MSHKRVRKTRTTRPRQEQLVTEATRFAASIGAVGRAIGAEAKTLLMFMFSIK